MENRLALLQAKQRELGMVPRQDSLLTKKWLNGEVNESADEIAKELMCTHFLYKNTLYSEMLEEYMRRMAAEVKKRYLLSWSAVWGIVRFYGPMSLKLFMAERCQVHMPERLSVDTRRDLPDSLLKSSSNE